MGAEKGVRVGCWSAVRQASGGQWRSGCNYTDAGRLAKWENAR